MAKIEKIQEVAIAELVPYERNAKIHSEEQVEKIANSIQEFGFLSPCLIDENYNLIAGHGRIEACKKLGIDKVPCLFIEGLTEAQRRAYILADNKLTEMGEWDEEMASKELEDLKWQGFDISLTGFNIDDIIIDEDMGADLTEEDVEEMAAANPRAKQGDIWKLGKHTLMCGDSTSPEDVRKLVGGG